MLDCFPLFWVTLYKMDQKHPKMSKGEGNAIQFLV